MPAAPHDADRSDGAGAEGDSGRSDGVADVTSGSDDSAGRTDDAGGRGGGSGAVDQGPGGRDVVVPLRIYKLVTVVTTLLAVPLVVLGFMFLDAATLQVSFTRNVILTALGSLGVPVDRGVLSAILAVIGLSIIAVGASVYVVGARFRAAGMGNAKESADEESTNG